MTKWMMNPHVGSSIIYQLLLYVRRDFSILLYVSHLKRWHLGTRSSINSWNFEDPWRDISVPLGMSTIIKINSKLCEKPEKKTSRADVWRRGLRKTRRDVHFDRLMWVKTTNRTIFLFFPQARCGNVVSCFSKQLLLKLYTLWHIMFLSISVFTAVLYQVVVTKSCLKNEHKNNALSVQQYRTLFPFPAIGFFLFPP